MITIPNPITKLRSVYRRRVKRTTIEGSDDGVRSRSTRIDDTEISDVQTVVEPGTDIGDSVDQSGYEDEKTTSDRKARSILSYVFGAIVIKAVNIARRLGIDRHLEANFAERAHAKAYAKQVGGTVVDDGSSAFTPDGGIDSFVDTPSGQKSIQTKHYAKSVDRSTINQYANNNDAIGATNGVVDSIDIEEYGIDVVTADDWPLLTRAELEVRRTINGCRKGVMYLLDGMRFIAVSLFNGGILVGRHTFQGAKWILNAIWKIGSVVATNIARYPYLSKFILFILVITMVYLLWRWYTADNEATADTDEAENSA